MGSARSRPGVKDVFAGNSLRKRRIGSSSLDGTITLNWIWEVADWIHLDQDRDQWRALVNQAMKFWVL